MVTTPGTAVQAAVAPTCPLVSNTKPGTDGHEMVITPPVSLILNVGFTVETAWVRFLPAKPA